LFCKMAAKRKRLDDNLEEINPVKKRIPLRIGFDIIHCGYTQKNGIDQCRTLADWKDCEGLCEKHYLRKEQGKIPEKLLTKFKIEIKKAESYYGSVDVYKDKIKTIVNNAFINIKPRDEILVTEIKAQRIILNNLIKKRTKMKSDFNEMCDDFEGKVATFVEKHLEKYRRDVDKLIFMLDTQLTEFSKNPENNESKLGFLKNVASFEEYIKKEESADSLETKYRNIIESNCDINGVIDPYILNQMRELLPSPKNKVPNNNRENSNNNNEEDSDEDMGTIENEVGEKTGTNNGENGAKPTSNNQQNRLQ